MNKNIFLGFGVRPSDKDFFKITKQQYKKNGDVQVGNYKLVFDSPTVKAYLSGDQSIMLAIRGTDDKRDVSADAQIAFNRLKYSDRYNLDKNIINQIVQAFPPNQYDYYLTGHSLGGAIINQLKRDFPFLKDSVQFNPAFQPYDLFSQQATQNKRYYTQDDPLYKIGGRLFSNEIVVPTQKPTISMPSNFASQAFNYYQGHALDNFNTVLGGMMVKNGNIIIPKKDFLKEHKNLINLLDKVNNEKKDQAEELKKVMKELGVKGGMSKSQGFIRAMIAKKPDMNQKVDFNINKIKNPSEYVKKHFGQTKEEEEEDETAKPFQFTKKYGERLMEDNKDLTEKEIKKGLIKLYELKVKKKKDIKLYDIEDWGKSVGLIAKGVHRDKFGKEHLFKSYTKYVIDRYFSDLSNKFDAFGTKKVVKKEEPKESEYEKAKSKKNELVEKMKNVKIPKVPKVKKEVKKEEQNKITLVEKKGDEYYIIKEDGDLDIVDKEEYDELTRNKHSLTEEKIINANNKFFKIVDDIINTKSPYTFSNNKPKYNEKINEILTKDLGIQFSREMPDFAGSIRDAVKAYDFYPTPTSALEGFKMIIERSEKILEPTAGLGYILNYIRKVNPKCEKTAIEFNAWFSEILRYFNPDTIINPDKNNDFLKYDPKKVDFDTIVINPPFTWGTDKRYYLEFLFHCLYLMNKSPISYSNICIICPNISDKKDITLMNIMDFAGKPKLKKIFRTYGFDLSDKELKILMNYEEEEELSDKLQKIIDMFDFWQCERLDKVSGFSGTNVKADRYIFHMGAKSKGKGKPSKYKIHAVIFKKPYNLQTAKMEARHILKSKKDKFMRETKGSYRFRNIPKQRFNSDSFRTQKVNPHISIIWGIEK